MAVGGTQLIWHLRFSTTASSLLRFHLVEAWPLSAFACLCFRFAAGCLILMLPDLCHLFIVITLVALMYASLLNILYGYRLDQV